MSSLQRVHTHVTSWSTLLSSQPWVTDFSLEANRAVSINKITKNIPRLENSLVVPEVLEHLHYQAPRPDPLTPGDPKIPSVRGHLVGPGHNRKLQHR